MTDLVLDEGGSRHVNATHRPYMRGRLVEIRAMTKKTLQHPSKFEITQDFLDIVALSLRY